MEVPIDKAPAYDGRFVFARVKCKTGPGGYYFRGLPAWAHGYHSALQGHRSEASLTKILNSVTNMNPHLDGTRVVDVSDPELFMYPIVYVTEAGYMSLDDKAVANLPDYLRKGGFMLFADFHGAYNWQNFTPSLHLFLPGHHLPQLTLSPPIFPSFFDI